MVRSLLDIKPSERTGSALAGLGEAFKSLSLRCRTRRCYCRCHIIYHPLTSSSNAEQPTFTPDRGSEVKSQCGHASAANCQSFSRSN